MSRLGSAIERGASVGMAVLLVLLLWPVMPAHAASEADGISGGAEQEALEAPLQEPEGLPDDEGLAGEGELRAAAVAADAVRDADAILIQDTLTIQDNKDELDRFAYNTPIELRSDVLGNAAGYEAEVEVAVAPDPSPALVSSVLDAQAVFEDDRLKISLDPLKMYDSADVTITVYDRGSDHADPDAQVASLSVNLSALPKKELEVLISDPLDFRFQAEQEEAIRGIIEGCAASYGVKLADVQEAGSFLDDGAGVSLSSYGAGSADFSTTARFALNGNLSDRYQLKAGSCSISVRQIQSISMPDGFLADAQGKACNGDTWTNQKVIASYAGHELSDALTGSYLPTYDSLNPADGTYAGLSLYAQDTTSHVITKIEDIAYNIDTVKPKPTDFSISGGASHGGILFFKSSAQVSVEATDDPGGAATPVFAGLDSGQSHIEYVDSRTGEVRSGQGASFADGDASGVLSFAVDGDQDTAISSFKAHIFDRAGNESDPDLSGVKTIPDEVKRIVADSSAPVISVAYDNNDSRSGAFFNGARTGYFTVTEPNFQYLKEYDPDQVIVTIVEDGQVHTYRASAFEHVGGDQWQVSYRFMSDDDYEVKAQVTDLGGASSELYETRFTVDASAPSINVTFNDAGAQNGNYFNAARTATVSVTEHNFSSDLIDVAPTSGAGNGTAMGAASVSGWSSDGDTHTCTVTFPGQGVYSLAVSGTDLALNALPPYTCPEFVVDTEKPQISIQVNGDADAGSRAYKEGCGVTVSISDTNADPSSTITVQPIGLNSVANPYATSPAISATEITFSSADPARTPENDNVYRVEVNARDMAGNTETKVVDWSVNRFGSTYILDESTQDMVGRKYLRTEDTRDVRITEINPSGLNEDDVLVSLTSGTKNDTLQRGEGYSFQANDANGWPAYDYTISKDNFASDGTYQVTLHSTDAAGNSSMNTMERKSSDRSSSAEVVFSVDNTAPIVTFNGIEGGQISESSHDVGFSIEDNMKLDRAIVRVNGEKVSTLDGEALANPENLKVTLGESAEDQIVTVEAYDMANNMDPQDSPAIFVNSNPLARWMHDPILVVSTLLGIAALGAAIFFLIRFRKDRREA